MTLDEFLYEQRLTMKAFATKIGFAASYVSEVKNGTRKPSARMVYVIKEVTQGRVNIENVDLEEKPNKFKQILNDMKKGQENGKV